MGKRCGKRRSYLGNDGAEGKVGYMPIRVLVADDHRLILRAVRHVLEGTDDIEIVGEARRGSQVLPLSEPAEAGSLSAGRPDARDGRADVRGADPQGVSQTFASSCCPPQTGPSGPRRRSRAAPTPTSRSRSTPPSFPTRCAGRVGASASSWRPWTRTEQLDERAGLTERELEVLQAVARGLANQAISSELWITEQTVKFHLTNIYRKLGVSSRTEAARYAFSRGIVAA